MVPLRGRLGYPPTFDDWILLLVANGHEPILNRDGTLRIFWSGPKCVRCGQTWSLAFARAPKIEHCTHKPKDAAP